MEKNIFYTGVIGAALFLIGFSLAYLSFGTSQTETENYYVPQAADHIEEEVLDTSTSTRKEIVAEDATLLAYGYGLPRQSYTLQTVYYANGEIDQKIIREVTVDEQKTTDTYISDVKGMRDSAIDEPLPGIWMFMDQIYGTSTPLVLLARVIPESDAGTHAYHILNLETKHITQVVGEPVTSSSRFFNHYHVVSPDGRYLLRSVTDIQTDNQTDTLEIIELATNQKIDEIVLPVGETIQLGGDGLRSQYAIAWLDNMTIVYKVLELNSGDIRIDPYSVPLAE